MKYTKAGALVCLLTAVALFLVAGAAFAGDKAKLPQPKGYVNDYAGVLTPQEASDLEATIRSVKEKTNAEIAVAVVPDLGGYADVEEYAVALFSDWKIGEKGKDNGVLVLVSMKERKVKIEVGYGLEGSITDGTAGEIIRDEMAPLFKSGKYGAGLIAGVRAISERIEPSGAPPKEKKRRPRLGFFFSLAVFIILMLVQLVIRGGGRRGGGFYGGGPYIGGFGGGFGGGGGGFGGGFGGGGGGFGGFGGGSSGGGGGSGGW